MSYVKAFFLKGLTSIFVFSILAPFLTQNYNQVYGIGGLQKLEFVFLSEYRNGSFLTPGLRCPDSHEVPVYGSLFITEGNLYGPGWVTPQHDRSFVLSDTMNHRVFLDIVNWRITGVPPNQQFIVEAIETQDILCNSDVPTDITIRGSCNPYSLATLTSKNGQRGEFKIMPLIGGGTDVEDHEIPICFVCAPNQHGWLEVDGWKCMDDDSAAMNATKSKDLTDTGANPSDIDSSIGQVERDVDIPQPQADDEQQTSTDDSPQISQKNQTEKIETEK